MNTHIQYMYRDGENYKLFHEVILAGEVTLEQLEEHYYEGDFFVPSEVGLEDLQEPPYRECDHVWHEIVAVKLTDDTPTVCLTARTLRDRFVAAGNVGWNNRTAVARMGQFV